MNPILWLISIVPNETKIDVLQGLGELYTKSTEDTTDDEALKIVMKVLRANKDIKTLFPIIMDLLELAAKQTGTKLDDNIVSIMRKAFEDLIE